MKFKLSIFCFAMLALNAIQARAQESQFIYEGRIDALYGYNMPSNRYKHNSPRDKTIYNLSLNLGWEKEFNDVRKLGLYADLNAGINRDMYNYNNGNWGQELYAIYDDMFGRIMLGETYNAAYQFQVGAPRVGAMGVNDSDIVNFMTNPNWIRDKHTTSFQTLNSTSINTDGVAPKITYITPEIYNTMFGFSYAPDSYDRRGLVNKFARYEDDSAYVFSLYTEQDLGFADMSAALGYGIFHQDDKEFSAGLSFYKGGWTLGASYRKSYVDGGDFPITEVSNNSRLPDLFDNYREGQAWDIGIGYEIGPYSVALSYLHSEAENTDNQDDIFMLSQQYQFNKYVDVYLIGAQVNFRGANKEIENNNKGYSVVAGVGLHF